MATELGDTAGLRDAIRNVIEAARKESRAFQQAPDNWVNDSMSALRESHLEELNAVQVLLGALELFEKRSF